MHRCRISVVALVALAIAVSALSGCGCLRKGLVRVNGDKISKEEFYDRVERVIVPSPGGNKMAGDAIMRKMIADKLVLQYAEKKGVTPTEEQIERQFALARKIEGGDLQRKLAMQGLTVEDFKREIRVATAQLNVMGKGITVPESKVKAAYEEIVKRTPSPYKRPEQRKISIIATSTKAKADQAYQQLKADHDFSSVAMRMSELPDSGQSGGKIDQWVSQGDQQVPKAIRNAAFTLRVQEFSQPFQLVDKNVKAWAIVRVDRKRNPLVIPYSEVKDVIRDQLKAQEGGKKSGKEIVSDLQRFIKSSDITINSTRYQRLPDEMKKQAGEVLKSIQKMPTPGVAPAQ